MLALSTQIVPGGPTLLRPAGNGSVFFVNSNGGGSATSGGLSEESAFTTIDAAIGACTASKGDTIYVMAGHAENITTATGINCDVAGIRIIGLGHGNLIPTVSFTAAAGSITVASASVTLQNLKLVANFAGGVTAGITIAAGGDGCTLDGVLMRDTTTDKEFLIHVSVATTVDDLVIRKCDFRGLGGTMSNSILFAGTSTNTLIEDTVILVDSSDDVIDHLVAAAVNCVIRRCTVVNADTDAAGYCIRHKSDGTGITHNCIMAYNKVDAEVSVGAAAWWVQNFASNTIADGGVLEPAGAAAIP